MKLNPQILYIATLCILVGCASIPPKEQIKEFHGVIYRTENGVQVKKSEWKYVHEYDPNGEINKTLYYHEGGLTSYTERQLDQESGLVISTTFDASGVKQRSNVSPQGDTPNWLKSYDSEGALIQIIQSKFDDQGRQIETTYFTGNETILHKLVKTYDDNLNTMTQTKYDAEGHRTQPHMIVNKYDENNNRIKQDWYDSPDRIHLSFDYTYLDGKRQTVIQSSTGKVHRKTAHKYDTRGNIKETHIYESDGNGEELKLSEVRVMNYKY